MAGFMKNAMSYLGMTDVVDEDDDIAEDLERDSAELDDGDEVTAMTQPSADSVASDAPAHKTYNFPSDQVSQITTIHPERYKEVEKVGRALRDGVPVVLNLSGVSDAVARRILDVASGVVYGVRGSMAKVTPTVFLLSPSRVNIKVVQTKSHSDDEDMF